MDIEAGLTYKVYMSFFVGPDYKGVTDPSWAESPYLWGQYEEDEDGKQLPVFQKIVINNPPKVEVSADLNKNFVKGTVEL